MLDDIRLNGINETYKKVLNEHRKLHETYKLQNNPEMLYCACYQDGIQHAFERIIAKVNTGYYSNKTEIEKEMNLLNLVKIKKQDETQYNDVAYIDGYITGISYLLMDDADRNKFPYYYVFGSDKNIRNLDAYKKECNLVEGKYTNAYKLAVRFAENAGDKAIHHTPFL